MAKRLELAIQIPAGWDIPPADCLICQLPFTIADHFPLHWFWLSSFVWLCPCQLAPPNDQQSGRSMNEQGKREEHWRLDADEHEGGGDIGQG
jgi:hypothetical protein